MKLLYLLLIVYFCLYLSVCEGGKHKSKTNKSGKNGKRGSKKIITPSEENFYDEGRQYITFKKTLQSRRLRKVVERENDSVGFPLRIYQPINHYGALRFPVIWQGYEDEIYLEDPMTLMPNLHRRIIPWLNINLYQLNIEIHQMLIAYRVDYNHGIEVGDFLQIRSDTRFPFVAVTETLNTGHWAWDPVEERRVCEIEHIDHIHMIDNHDMGVTIVPTLRRGWITSNDIIQNIGNNVNDLRLSFMQWYVNITRSNNNVYVQLVGSQVDFELQSWGHIIQISMTRRNVRIGTRLFRVVYVNRVLLLEGIIPRLRELGVVIQQTGTGHTSIFNWTISGAIFLMIFGVDAFEKRSGTRTITISPVAFRYAVANVRSQIRIQFSLVERNLETNTITSTS